MMLMMTMATALSMKKRMDSWRFSPFRPSVIHYETRSVIFAGGNDGMFHAFDDETGEELWAFIPPDLLNKLQALHQDVLEIFVDGSSRAYISHNEDGSIYQAILILSEREGEIIITRLMLQIHSSLNIFGRSVRI
jgi:hypothetical protein